MVAALYARLLTMTLSMLLFSVATVLTIGVPPCALIVAQCPVP
jgi:hypothetical protein